MAISIADIEAVVLEYYPLQKSKPEELKGNKKYRDLSKVRNVTTYVAMESGYRYKDLAKYYRQKADSIMRAYHRTSDEISVTPAYRDKVSKIFKKIKPDDPVEVHGV